MHSSVVDKQPTPASLEVGELAVNLSADKEFISLKNTNNKVVRLSSDEQLIDWMELKTVIPYSGNVDNVDLVSNKSNIEIKLNQVVADNTKFHEKVNGAKDIDGQLINPSTDGGITNGAGFKIDTSMFVLGGSNPSFSSITSTCGTRLEGTTEIIGLNGACGSLLDIKVNTENVSANTATTIIGTATTTIGTDTTTITNSTLALGTETKTVSGNSTTTITGTTTLNRNGDVTENNQSNYTVNTTGNTVLNTNGNLSAKTNGSVAIRNNGSVTINNRGNVTESTSGDVLTTIKGSDTVNVTSNMCLNSDATASLYGASATKVGVTCDGTQSTGETEIAGKTIIISGVTNNIYGTTNINSTTNISSGLNVVGITNLASGLTSDLEWKYDSVTGASSGKTNFSGSNTSTITIPKDAGHINRRQLNIDYLTYNESMEDKPDSVYDPGAASNTTAYAPMYVKNLGRATLKYEYVTGCSDSNFVEGTYDPGSQNNFNGQVANTIKIPKTIEALENSCGNCISISKDVCVSGSVSATEGIYQASDRNLKENIKYIDNSITEKAEKILFSTFNMKSDASKRKMYGVIAQDVERAGLEELIHYDEKGLKSVDYTGLLVIKVAMLEHELKKAMNEINKLKEKI